MTKCKNWPPMWRMIDVPAIRRQIAEGESAACLLARAGSTELAFDVYRATAGLELLAMLAESGEMISGGYAAALDKAHGFKGPESNAFAPSLGRGPFDPSAAPALAAAHDVSASNSAAIDAAFADYHKRSRIEQISARMTEIAEEIEGLAPGELPADKWLALIAETHALTAEGFALIEEIEGDADEDEDGDNGASGAPAAPAKFAGELILAVREEEHAEPKVLNTFPLASVMAGARLDVNLSVERAA